MKNQTLLARIYGEMCAFVCLPLNKPLGNAATNDHAGWLAAYFTRGLPFAATRPEAEALRGFVAAGWLSTKGATQGKTHALTGPGVQVAMAALGESWKSSGELLASIIRKQSESPIVSPYAHGDGDRLVMNWHLIPQAGEWLEKAQATDKAWRKYIAEVCRLQGILAPLLILNFVNLYHDGAGYWWGLMPTEAGRVVAEQWPDELPASDEEESFFDAWKDGLERREKYATPPPKEFSNVCAARLPAGGW